MVKIIIILFIFFYMGLYRRKNESDPLNDQLEGHGGQTIKLFSRRREITSLLRITEKHIAAAIHASRNYVTLPPYLRRHLWLKA